MEGKTFHLMSYLSHHSKTISRDIYPKRFKLCMSGQQNYTNIMKSMFSGVVGWCTNVGVVPECCGEENNLKPVPLILHLLW